MVDRELGLKVVTKFDNKGLVATKRELRDAGREADKARTPFKKLSDDIENINRLEGRGLINQRQAATRRDQLRNQTNRQTLDDAGLGRFSALFGTRGPLVGAMVGLSAGIALLTKHMQQRARELESAEELGVPARDLSALRALLRRLDVPGSAIDAATKQLGDRAARRGTTLFEEAERARQGVLARPSERGRALTAERRFGSRAFGRRGVLDDAPFPVPGPAERPFGAGQDVEFESARTRRSLYRGLLDVLREIITTKDRGFDPAASRLGLDPTNARIPFKVEIDNTANVNNL